MIRDLAEAYLVIIGSDASDDDKMMCRDSLIGAFLTACDKVAAPKASADSETNGSKPPMAGLEREDFEAIMKKVGYIDLEMGFSKWFLQDFDTVSRDDRLSAMAGLRNLLPESKQDEAKVGNVINAPFDEPDYFKCPRCGKGEAWDNKTYFACKDKECFRPNGKHTTWDRKNYARVAAE